MKICSFCKDRDKECVLRRWVKDRRCGKFRLHPRLGYLDENFMYEMANNMRKGADRPGRFFESWKVMDWSNEVKDEYCAKVYRHFEKATAGTGTKNYAAVACNAMILAFHES